MDVSTTTKIQQALTTVEANKDKNHTTLMTFIPSYYTLLSKAFDRIVAKNNMTINMSNQERENGLSAHTKLSMLDALISIAEEDSPEFFIQILAEIYQDCEDDLTDIHQHTPSPVRNIKGDLQSIIQKNGDGNITNHLITKKLGGSMQHPIWKSTISYLGIHSQAVAKGKKIKAETLCCEEWLEKYLTLTKNAK